MEGRWASSSHPNRLKQHSSPREMTRSKWTSSPRKSSTRPRARCCLKAPTSRRSLMPPPVPSSWERQARPKPPRGRHHENAIKVGRTMATSQLQTLMLPSRPPSSAPRWDRKALPHPTLHRLRLWRGRPRRLRRGSPMSAPLRREHRGRTQRRPARQSPTARQRRPPRKADTRRQCWEVQPWSRRPSPHSRGLRGKQSPIKPQSLQLRCRLHSHLPSKRQRHLKARQPLASQPPLACASQRPRQQGLQARPNHKIPPVPLRRGTVSHSLVSRRAFPRASPQTRLHSRVKRPHKALLLPAGTGWRIGAG